MGKHTTMAEVRRMVERGDFGDVTYEQFVEQQNRGICRLVALGMGIPFERIVGVAVHEVDEAMPGKVGLEITFDPGLTAEEDVAYRAVMSALAKMSGGRPPIFPDQA